MRGDSAIVFRSSTIDAAWSECIGGLRIVCYDYQSCGEVSERLKELASKASVGGTLPWVQIPPSPPFVLCQGSYTFQIEAALRLTFHERIQQRLPQEQNSIPSQTSPAHQTYRT